MVITAKYDIKQFACAIKYQKSGLKKKFVTIHIFIYCVVIVLQQLTFCYKMQQTVGMALKQIMRTFIYFNSRTFKTYILPSTS